MLFTGNQVLTRYVGNSVVREQLVCCWSAQRQPRSSTFWQGGVITAGGLVTDHKWIYAPQQMNPENKKFYFQNGFKIFVLRQYI